MPSPNQDHDSLLKTYGTWTTERLVAAVADQSRDYTAEALAAMLSTLKARGVNAEPGQEAGPVMDDMRDWRELSPGHLAPQEEQVVAREETSLALAAAKVAGDAGVSSRRKAGKLAFEMQSVSALLVVILSVYLIVVVLGGRPHIRQHIDSNGGRIYYELIPYSGALAFGWIFSAIVMFHTVVANAPWFVRAFVVALPPFLFIALFAYLSSMPATPGFFVWFQVLQGTLNFDSEFARSLEASSFDYRWALILDVTHPTAPLIALLTVCADAVRTLLSPVRGRIKTGNR